MHNHIVGLSNRNPEFIDRNRLDVISVSLDDRHLQSRNADVEIGHGRRIDEPHSDTLTGLEEAGPVLPRPLAIDQRRKALQVLDVGWHHAHFAPGAAIRQGLVRPHFLRIVQKIEQSTLLPIVVVWHHLEIAHDPIA